MAIVGYEYRIDGGSPVDMGLPDPLTCTVPGLSPSTEYDFEVRGYDAEGNRTQWSNIATASTLGLPAMIQWLKPEAIDGSYADDDTILLWPDSSENGYDAVGASPGGGGGGPLYKDNVLNGFPVSRFVSIGDPGSGANGRSLSLDGANGASGFSAYEAVIVFRLSDETPADASKAGFWNMTATPQTSADFRGSQIKDTFCSTTNHSCGDPTDNLENWTIYSVYSAANDWGCYVNRTLQHSTATNTVSFGASDLGVSNLPSVPLFAPFLNGDVAEFILWGKKLSTPEREFVWDYLEAKYGL